MDVSNNDYFNVWTTSGNDFSSFALDTLDRIINTTPEYYGYIAYQVSDSAYKIIRSPEFSVNGDTLYFTDCNIGDIYCDDAGNFYFDTHNDISYQITLESSQVYYTNMVSGYPSLGDPELSFTNVLIVGLLCSVLALVGNRISRR